MQKTMLDILKERLPKRLTIDTVKETNSKYNVEFSFEGESAKAELPKSCAPGCHNEVADYTVITAMSNIYMSRGEYAEAKEWLDKIGKK